MKVRLSQTFEKITTICFIGLFVLVTPIEVIPREMGQTESKVDETHQEVSRKLLMNVADQLTGEWKNVGRYLDLSESDIQNITSNHRQNEAEAKLQMLLKWKQHKGDLATHKALADAFSKAKRFDLAQTLFEGRELLGKYKEQILIGELKSKYKILYDAVQPIPYIRDKWYCVDRVFVEGGIEYLVAVNIGTHGSWSDLETYHNIFNDERVKSKRCIVEGEPGYGKSTLTLQLAYDWCNTITASALSKVDIFILLRLRQLGGVKSIYRAIKQFLLPKDSRLTEADIEDIIRNSLSVVVVLDGFDEYPDRGNDSDSDFLRIIKMEMFQQTLYFFCSSIRRTVSYT